MKVWDALTEPKLQYMPDGEPYYRLKCIVEDDSGAVAEDYIKLEKEDEAWEFYKHVKSHVEPVEIHDYE